MKKFINVLLSFILLPHLLMAGIGDVEMREAYARECLIKSTLREDRKEKIIAALVKGDISHLSENVSENNRLRKVVADEFEKGNLVELIPSIWSFDLSSLYYKTVPLFILKFTNLTELNLSHNGIETLPKEFASSFPALTSVNLSDNNLKEFPHILVEAESLVSADLSDNLISKLSGQGPVPPSLPSSVNDDDDDVPPPSFDEINKMSAPALPKNTCVFNLKGNSTRVNSATSSRLIDESGFYEYSPELFDIENWDKKPSPKEIERLKFWDMMRGVNPQWRLARLETLDNEPASKLMNSLERDFGPSYGLERRGIREFLFSVFKKDNWAFKRFEDEHLYLQSEYLQDLIFAMAHYGGSETVFSRDKVFQAYRHAMEKISILDDSKLPLKNVPYGGFYEKDGSQKFLTVSESNLTECRDFTPCFRSMITILTIFKKDRYEKFDPQFMNSLHRKWSTEECHKCDVIEIMNDCLAFYLEYDLIDMWRLLQYMLSPRGSHFYDLQQRSGDNFSFDRNIFEDMGLLFGKVSIVPKSQSRMYDNFRRLIPKFSLGMLHRLKENLEDMKALSTGLETSRSTLLNLANRTIQEKIRQGER